MTSIIFTIIAYLLGSLNSAILVCRFMKYPDPRTTGSQNPGATNVLRTCGKQAAAIVLISDALKGFIPVVLAHLFGVYGFALGIVGVAAVLGHIFPLFFQFKGGKGVATALGVFLGLSFPLGILALLTWGLVAYFSRYSSLASLATAVLTPIYVLIFSHSGYFFPVLVIAALLVWQHWENIERLRLGTETKINF